MAIDPSAAIHASAVVESGAEIGAGCVVGPFSHIGPDATLGQGVEIKSHGVVAGVTDIGDDTVIYPFASVGHAPQDLKYAGERTRLSVGKRAKIREAVTLNTGTDGGGGITKIGDDCLFMAGSHIGHDSQLGNGVILAPQASVGGHCHIDDNVIIGALAGIHQFVRIGKGAIIGGLAAVVQDVIPYGSVVSHRGHLGGLNLIGLRRRDIPKSEINALRAAYKGLFEGEGTLLDRAEIMQAENGNSELVAEVVSFVLGKSDRSFCQPE